MGNISSIEILNYLEKKGVISNEQANQISLELVRQNFDMDNYLLEKIKINKTSLLEAYSSYFNVSYIDLSTLPINPHVLSFVPKAVAQRFKVIPFEVNEKDGTLKLAMINPSDFTAIDFIEKKTSKRVIPFFCLKKDFDNYVDFLYSQEIAPDVVQALKEVQLPYKSVDANEIGNVIKEAPIAKIVTTILEYAVKGRASDVHIEPQENLTRIRYRIDGILNEKLLLPKGIHDSLVSRIKILSGLKIDEKRLPQDGRFNFKLGEEEVDLRVSTLPTVHGEKVVLRLLKKTGGVPSLHDLGLRGNQLNILLEAINKPYGIILVTGPTGSGKSTTLYSVLSSLNKPGVNIVTLEDPVEYQIPGINQVQINAQIGLTFANGLRAFLRQDPNIILVGEIRDKETTQLAIQAALTGHLVFSTLHTNDAPTTIPRLIDLGAEPFLISSVLNAIVAQRICRKVCPYCKKDFIADQNLVNDIKSVLQDYLPSSHKEENNIRLYKGTGCQYCNNTGYYERIGIFEILRISPMINKLIMTQADAKEIFNQAKKEGFMTMKQEGYLKALEGITTIEEVLRVAEL